METFLNWITQQPRENSLKRIKTLKILFDCNGIVSLSYKKSSFSIKFKHGTHHETQLTKPRVTERKKQRITSRFDSGFSSFQILNSVHK